MPRTIALLTMLFAAAATSSAQSLVQTSPSVQIAPAEALNVLPAGENLPDAPEVSPSLSTPEDEGQAGTVGKPNTPVAPKFASIILPGQRAVPLTAGDKFAYSFHDAFNLYQLLGITISAGYEQVTDSKPHYGPGAEGFGKREGVAALRNTVQTLSTDAIFAPIFHDDPRYYELGQGHCFFCRAAYAATRIVVTRSDSGRGRLNAPLLLGYAVASGVNNAYYPDQDTGAKASAESFATSLGGEALGFIADEFVDDALRMVHLRK